MMPRYRVGVDIGGTFTDAVAIDEESGEIITAKVPSTPQDPSAGFIAALEEILKKAKNGAREFRLIFHATTLGTNAILEGKGPTTGFITTKGFRDILEIQRQIKPKLYDLFQEKPKPLVPRNLCIEVSERIGPDGEVLLPLNEDDVKRAAETLKKNNVVSVAVCLINSYINPNHEKRIGDILRKECPKLFISLSSEVNPEFREYFRASTTIINAFLMPLISEYLDKVLSALTTRGIAAELYIMQSNGGLAPPEFVKNRPAYIVESGPAAGVIAGQFIGSLLGEKDLITLDMGGTTAKVGLVERGMYKLAVDYEVGSMARAELGFTKGGGYPLRTPVIDLVEVGAGGGSIAWIDQAGALHVGPRSAGAEPGPVCYGKGGTEPTVTDANLVLGRLCEEHFLGGAVKLDKQGATNALKKLAEALGLELLEAAYGVIEIANASMLRAMRSISVERGYDPRDFSFIVFGGAGPLHANALAAELEVKRVIIPPSPGVASALGLIVTDVKHDYSVTRIQRLDTANVDEINATYSRFEAEARAQLARDGIAERDMRLLRFMDVRYVGQSYELRLPVPHGKLSRKDLEEIIVAFHEEHERVYGHAERTEPVEMVNLRLEAIGVIVKPRLKRLNKADRPADNAVIHVRNVYFRDEGLVSCKVYDRRKLLSGHVIEGPAIVEEHDSTTVILPGYSAEVDELGNLIILKM